MSQKAWRDIQYMSGSIGSRCGIMLMTPPKKFFVSFLSSVSHFAFSVIFFGSEWGQSVQVKIHNMSVSDFSANDLLNFSV